jgi:thioesterase domain-containing protein
MAADRLRAVKAIQPSGPYRLGGFCNGGVIAFEMARQIEQQGAAVDVLLLVDSRALNGPPIYQFLDRAAGLVRGGRRSSPAARRALFLWLRAHVEDFVESARPEGGGRPRYLLNKIRAVGRRRPGRTTPDTAVDEVSEEAALRSVYGERLRDYVPGRYDGRVVLFRSSHLETRPPAGPTAGWHHVSRAVDVHPLPGNHQLAVTRYVEVLAEKMAPYLSSIS